MTATEHAAAQSSGLALAGPTALGAGEVPTLPGYRHAVASHCESGSLRNLLAYNGLSVSEPMVFGLGSGPLFYYLFFAKGPSTFPLVGQRNAPSNIVKNFARLCGVDVSLKRYGSAAQAMARADELLAQGVPVTATVDMFRMKYLPSFLRVHAPFHFIVLIGKNDRAYAVSDPYSQKLGVLERADLEAAWETHAPLAKDNLLCHVRRVPPQVDFKRAVRKAMLRTCRDMLGPPLFAGALWFVGVAGMRTYARAMRQWPSKYRGVALREGMIFNAIAFEDQGTGGAAFRLVYGAFLQEAAALYGSRALEELAQRLIEHGKTWRAASRQLVTLSRPIPMEDASYQDWFAKGGAALQQGLDEVSQRFLAFADFEQAFYRDLRKVASGLS